MAKGSNPNCMYDAIESYPEFSEPPWEELNPRDHFELLVKLMKYAQEGGTRYFTGPALVTEAGYRKRAEDFITRSHGQMQVWRTSLLWDFVDLGKPRHEQSIVKLTYKDGTSASTEGCPAKGSHDWVRWTFIVSSDLSGPDPTINNGTGLFSPTSAWPVLYDGKAVLINTYSVHWPMASCMYKFVEPDTRESKEK